MLGLSVQVSEHLFRGARGIIDPLGWPVNAINRVNNWRGSRLAQGHDGTICASPSDLSLLNPELSLDSKYRLG